MSGKHEMVPGGFGHSTSHCKHCYATEREIAFALGPVCPSAPAAELRDFASLMVDEVIAKVRLQLDAGESLSAIDQRLMLEQLIVERKRLHTTTPAPDKLDAATIERCAQVADTEISLIFSTSATGYGANVARRIRDKIRNLANGEQQHGGKGA